MFKKSLLSVAVALTLSACGGSSSGGGETTTPTPPTTPTNQAPTAITLSQTSVAENAAGAVVGDLAATDADSGDTHTFTVSDDRFEISGSQLKLKADTVLDYESEKEVALTIQVTDSASNTFSDNFTVTVTDVAEAPTAISLSAMEVAENATGAVIGDLAVTDPDAGDTFTFTVSDDRFEVVNSQLKLKADNKLNYESEQSVTVSVEATDSASNKLSVDFNVVVTDLLDTYTFNNATANASSVSYSGQIARHLLIAELNNYISSGLQADLDSGAITTEQAALDRLVSYYDGDWELEVADRTLTTSTIVKAKQTKFGDVSSSSKNLDGKIAGNDAVGQHKDWSTEFVAFGAKGSQSPEQLIRALLTEIAANAGQTLAGNVRQDALGNDITKVYLAADGRDLKQLVQKILLGSVAFSQGADDYLDNDTDGKGLLSDNTALVEGKDYTSLEHQFDEGFGYFGAARDYLDYSDDEIANKGGREAWAGMHDTNGDSEIDFNSEYNFGHSQNAAKRDRGTASRTNPTDLTAEAMNAFLKGRKVIADANTTALTDAQKTELFMYRDAALMAWEKSIAATAVHYINDTTDDYANWGTGSFSYADLAKHWSELKGFLVSLQFNRLSPLTDAQFEQANTLIGDAPVLVDANVAAYLTDLKQARDILQAAYGFDAENVANW